MGKQEIHLNYSKQKAIEAIRSSRKEELLIRGIHAFFTFTRKPSFQLKGKTQSLDIRVITSEYEF
jgi:hypothetical protein